jgi:hypothetical protein
MTDQQTQPILYTQDELHNYSLALVASVTQQIHADLLEAILNPLPLDAWPPIIAAGLARAIEAYPRPRDLITHLLHALAEHC